MNLKMIFALISLLFIAQTISSNEKTAVLKSASDAGAFKISFSAGSKAGNGYVSGTANDEIIERNIQRANGYIGMGVAGVVLAALGLPAGAGVFVAILSTTNFSVWYGALLGLLAAFGGFLLGIITAAAFIAPGVLMAVYGFSIAKKIKKNKVPDPFIEFENSNKAVSMGWSYKISSL